MHRFSYWTVTFRRGAHLPAGVKLQQGSSPFSPGSKSQPERPSSKILNSRHTASRPSAHRLQAVSYPSTPSEPIMMQRYAAVVSPLPALPGTSLEPVEDGKSRCTLVQALLCRLFRGMKLG